MDNLQFVLSFMGLAFLSGFGFTLGMSVVCWALKWNPCNVAIHVHTPRDSITELRIGNTGEANDNPVRA